MNRIAFALALLAACGTHQKNLCEGVPGRCVGFAAGTSEKDIQTALVTAADDTTFVFAGGTFSFQNSVDLAAAGLTVAGQGKDVTVLDFKDQVAGSEGMSVTGGRFTLRDLAIRDPKGDGV